MRTDNASNPIAERGIFLANGLSEINGFTLGEGCMISLKPGADVTIKALGDRHSPKCEATTLNIYSAA